VKCRCVYKTKHTSVGFVEFHKDQLVVKGFSHQEGINYAKIFAPFAKMNFVQLIFSLDACFLWNAHRMDVKSYFLHGDFSE